MTTIEICKFCMLFILSGISWFMLGTMIHNFLFNRWEVINPTKKQLIIMCILLGPVYMFGIIVDNGKRRICNWYYRQ